MKERATFDDLALALASGRVPGDEEMENAVARAICTTLANLLRQGRPVEEVLFNQGVSLIVSALVVQRNVTVNLIAKGHQP